MSTMTTEEVEISVLPHMLRSYQNQSLQWSTVLGELCDNSFDAGATQIDISFGPGARLQVKDNGNGCDDVLGMISIGHHMKQATTRSGRYGIGLKESACWMWGELLIQTTHNGVTYGARVDWETLANKDRFLVPSPTTSAANPGDPKGTLLTFRNITRSVGSYERLIDDIGYRFAPALWAGARIFVDHPSPKKRQHRACKAWEPPANMEGVVDCRFEIGGKGVHLRAGFIPTGTTCFKVGFTYCLGHRVIEDACGLGAGGLSYARVCGVVTLADEWGVSKNKTDITDEDRDALADAVFARCKHLLERSASESDDIYNTEFNQDISARLQAIFSTRKRKEKRESPKNKSGAVEPKNSGRKRRTARKTQDGDGIEADVDLGKLTCQWLPMEDGELGDVDWHSNTIKLNKDHKWLAHLRANRNREAVVSECMWIVGHSLRDRSNKKTGDFGFTDGEKIPQWVARILSAQLATDEALSLA